MLRKTNRENLIDYKTVQSHNQSFSFITSIVSFMSHYVYIYGVEISNL